jgi:hypothetical protein
LARRPGAVRAQAAINARVDAMTAEKLQLAILKEQRREPQPVGVEPNVGQQLFAPPVHGNVAGIPGGLQVGVQFGPAFPVGAWPWGFPAIVDPCPPPIHVYHDIYGRHRVHTHSSWGQRHPAGCGCSFCGGTRVVRIQQPRPPQREIWYDGLRTRVGVRPR